MTVYQDLQLNQAGSKNLIRSCADQKEKKKAHSGISVENQSYRSLLCDFCKCIYFFVWRREWCSWCGSSSGIAGVSSGEVWDLRLLKACGL